jgi:hypothetical protein
VTVDLAGRIAIIIDSPPDSFNYTITTAEGEVIHHSRPYPYRHFLITGSSVVLGAVFPRADLPIWILPEGTCGAGSAVLSSEHNLELTSWSSSHLDPLCLFTQAHFDEAELSVTVKSKDKHTSIEFYGASGAPERRSIYKLGEKCKNSADKPFFLRIRSNPNITLSVKLDYEIDDPAKGTVYCSVLSVPWIRDGGYNQITQVLGGVKFTCRSQALDVLGILGFLGLALLVAFVVVGCFHGWRLTNMGDWLFPDFEKQRFENLKKTPFANELGDAHVEAQVDDI